MITAVSEPVTMRVDYSGTLYDLDFQIHILECTNPNSLIGDEYRRWLDTLVTLRAEWRIITGRPWRYKLDPARNEYLFSPAQIRDQLERWYILNDAEGLRS